MDSDIPLEAVDFLHESSDADSTNRSEEMEDLRFSYGDQWAQQMQNQRQLEQRPWFVVNETETYIRQICNQIRQQRPRMKAQGMNNSVQAKMAEIVTGVTRHIEQASDADTAYDTASEYAVRIGRGYIRLTADYVSEESFDQDILIRPVFNPFTVYGDPNGMCPDGSDWDRCLITDLIPRARFEKLYPDADAIQFNARATGDGTSDWITKNDIRIAEFYKIRQTKKKLVHLSDGNTFWDDEMPDQSLLDKVGVKIKGDRESWKKEVCWYKVTGVDVLEERLLPGRFIPVVPVYGAHMIVDGRTHRFGVVRAAKDPQRLLNFMRTAVVENVTMQPKAKHLIAEGQDEGFEDEWNQANVKALTRLHYKTHGDDGSELPPPIPIAPPPIPDGLMAASEAAHMDLQRVLGMFDPAMTAPGNTSGKALNSMQQQSDMSNFHFYDNLTRSMKHVGRIILSWLPVYYGKKRVLRIIGEDGKPDVVTLNDDAIIGKIENDMTVGEYDIVMETGPGYNSKREQAFQMLSQLAEAYPPLMQIGGDLIVRYSDAPGADILADRLAASNPLAQIDDKSDIPPKAQLMIKQLQQQNTAMTQQLQQAGMLIKTRGDIEAHKEAGETHRTIIKEQAETERRQMENASYLEDVHVKAQATLGAKEIDGVIALLTKFKDQQEGERNRSHERDLAVFERVANREEAQVQNTNGAQ